MNKTLLFVEPVFNSGVNLTVRKGDKWHNQIGEIKIKDVNDENTTHKGVIFRTEKTTLAKVEKQSHKLKEEHDPKCRNIQGLREELNEIYGNVGDSDVITLVWFKVDKR